jgi:RimJ/RimL family protein N-acetyltransferase/N-acetylglutamate synthase-like GNAT family acetyltransferase
VFATLSFRPLAEDDLPMLHEWVRRPHVAEWWSEPGTLEEIEADYLPTLDGSSSTRAFIASLDGEPIGFIQVYVVQGSGDGWWEDETDAGARGIDQFLADPGRLNQGLGTAMIKAFVERLFEDPGVSKVQTDPSPDNARAIGCYRKVGFEDVGEVMTPDGPALLMLYQRARASRTKKPLPRPTDSGFEIRSAAASDVEAIHRLLASNGWAHRIPDAAYLGRLIPASHTALVAVADGEVAGFARAISDGLSNGYLSMVVVAEPFRKRGIGRALVQRIVGSEAGITWVLRAGRPGAAEFFAKLGFTTSSVAMERSRGQPLAD